jgi:phosphohistidine swiveling domain-containing protein
MAQREQTVPVVVIIHKDMLLLQYQGANVTVDHQRKIVPVIQSLLPLVTNLIG